MRFTLLCASTALAASLLLSACSSGAGSSAIPGGSQSVTLPMGHHNNLHVAMVGGHRAQSCPSGYLECYIITAGSPATFEWCIINVTGGNCTSNLAPGRWGWANTAPNPGKPQTLKLKTGRPTGSVKSTWSPRTANPTDNDITSHANVKSTNDVPGYSFSWEACAKSGPYKGSCVGPEPIGIIVN